MIRYLILFVISAFIIFLSLYISNSYTSCNDNAESFNPGRKAELIREAELVSYFCLSKRPPVRGEELLPRAWESALNASIELFDNTSEAGSRLPDSNQNIDEISTLSMGSGIYAESDKKGILVFRPEQSPEWYIVISKPLEEFEAIEAEAAGGQKCNSGGFLVISLLAGLVVTVLARFILRPATQS